MPLKTQPLDEPGLNLTSMLDVVMLLIIFFMVGTQFSQEERSYDIEVPTVADLVAMTDQPDELIVNVAADGSIEFRQQPASIESLEAELAKAIANFPNQAVIIRGDRASVYQAVMDVMSACRRAGVRNISLAHRAAAESR
ncbi:MAG: biopolymer transporter ExbD [Planctomycetaceae bacterium]|nr:biopolymer transporter ExbD [Planctomycetaceae bacterium]